MRLVSRIGAIPRYSVETPTIARRSRTRRIFPFRICRQAVSVPVVSRVHLLQEILRVVPGHAFHWQVISLEIARIIAHHRLPLRLRHLILPHLESLGDRDLMLRRIAHYEVSRTNGDELLSDPLLLIDLRVLIDLRGRGDRFPEKTKPGVVLDRNKNKGRGHGAAAIRHAGEPLIIDPGTATQHFLLKEATGRPLRICLRPSWISPVRVLHPFPHIALHVIQAPRVRLFLSHRMRLLP